MVETLRIYIWKGRVRFRKRESTREAKTADIYTYIYIYPISRLRE